MADYHLPPTATPAEVSAAIRANGTEKAIYERYHVDFSLTTDPSILTE